MFQKPWTNPESLWLSFYRVETARSATWFVGGKPEQRCHLFVKNGQIEYCSDSTHSLAGKTVPMVDRDWSEYGFGD